jgi:hypothetical protein
MQPNPSASPDARILPWASTTLSRSRCPRTDRTARRPAVSPNEPEDGDSGPVEAISPNEPKNDPAGFSPNEPENGEIGVPLDFTPERTVSHVSPNEPEDATPSFPRTNRKIGDLAKIDYFGDLVLRRVGIAHHPKWWRDKEIRMVGGAYPTREDLPLPPDTPPEPPLTARSLGFPRTNRTVGRFCFAGIGKSGGD